MPGAAGTGARDVKPDIRPHLKVIYKELGFIIHEIIFQSSSVRRRMYSNACRA